MEKNEFLEKIAPLLPDNLTSDQTKALIWQFTTSIKDMPLCNKCGKFFKPGWGSSSVDVHWGYESTGKDTDQDKWRLCQDCCKDFCAKYVPICSMCNRSIVEVTAELSSRNPHCTFFGNPDAAKTHYQTYNHYGLEYAKIEGRIVCEICYEQFISDFNIPIQAGEYDVWTGEYDKKEGTQHQNRIEEAFSFRLTKDAVSSFYETFLSYDEVVAIRCLGDPSNRAIKLRFRQCTQKMLERHRKDDPTYEDTASFQTGTGTYVEIPLSWLEKEAKEEGVELDITKPFIKKQGEILGFGELELVTHHVVKKFK
jgi:hypothetical protein